MKIAPIVAVFAALGLSMAGLFAWKSSQDRNDAAQKSAAESYEKSLTEILEREKAAKEILAAQRREGEELRALNNARDQIAREKTQGFETMQARLQLMQNQAELEQTVLKARLEAELAEAKLRNLSATTQD